MPTSISSTGLTITNPLVLYRALLSTKQISPDPAQHRLAIHLQKLYDRLRDYEPEIEYKQRLDQISTAVNEKHETPTSPDISIGIRGVWQSLLTQKEKRDSLALTTVITSHEAALKLDSPKGLMLHGEVGTGKSMLIDLFADCLPNRKKRRWHFNTFMLDTFARLEQLRHERVSRTVSQEQPHGQNDYSLLWLARSLIKTSPILFLDEFQLPDRAASKIMSNLMTSFFQLGGVLIATSNRMPEELAKAAGMEFTPPPTRMESLAWRLGLRRGESGPGRSENLFAGKGEFAGFLEVLKARCEIWEMEGGKDYRRQESEGGLDNQRPITYSEGSDTWHGPVGVAGSELLPEQPTSATTVETAVKAPLNYFIKPAPDSASTVGFVANFNSSILRIASLPTTASIIPWTSTSVRVYGRNVPVPRSYSEITHWTFAELCQTELGAADYITLASTFHTFIITDIPVLTILQKNEARRFITLLDALYEARCKLLVSAAAGPDDIFFPESRRSSTKNNSGLGTDQIDEDALLPETFAEAYQDITAPFRPNISSYSPSSSSFSLPADALEDDPPNRLRRRGHASDSSGDAYDIRREDRTTDRRSPNSPDFSDTTTFTGEDERFAYRRARSRLWEMCGRRWWARDEEGWWRPVERSVRRWEGGRGSEGAVDANNMDADADLRARIDAELARSSSSDSVAATMRDPVLEGERAVDDIQGVGMGAEREGKGGVRGERGLDKNLDEPLFRHGASPFRTSAEPPPKFNWTHVWGTMRWGKKAGVWGKGVEGLQERERERERLRDKEEEGREKEKGKDDS